MEYEKLIYINSRGESLELSINSRYHCNVSKDVTGLDGVENTIYSSNSIGQYGDTYVGQRFEPREIGIIGYIKSVDKDEAIELRRRAERILNAELGGNLIYQYKQYSRIINCKIDGKPTFSRNRVLISFTIHLICHDPFWRELNEQKKDIAAWVSSWEFDFEIPEEGIELGYREPSILVNVNNEGDVKSGIRVDFIAKGTVTNPSLINVNTKEYIKLEVTMSADDVITINTGYGNKSVMLKRNGQMQDYFARLNPYSTFLQLDIGDNIFRYEAESGGEALEVAVYYNNKYLGV